MTSAPATLRQAAQLPQVEPPGPPRALRARRTEHPQEILLRCGVPESRREGQGRRRSGWQLNIKYRGRRCTRRLIELLPKTSSRKDRNCERPHGSHNLRRRLKFAKEAELKASVRTGLDAIHAKVARCLVPRHAADRKPLLQVGREEENERCLHRSWK